VTTEIKGQIEPCGCTSDPLGDLARIAELLTQARTGGQVLFLDGGSFLYAELAPPDARRAQEQLKAELLAAAFQDHLGAAAVGLGPYDLAAGVARVAPPRQAANLEPQSGVALEPPKLVTVGGIAVGIFGVVAPELVANLGVVAGDPAAAARAAVTELRGRGARVVVGLAHMPRQAARELAGAVEGVDFLVVGRDAPEPDQVAPGPERAGATWLVQPANRGQVVTRLDVTVRGPGALVDAIGEARAAAEGDAIDERRQRLATDLATWRADPTADPDFLSAKEAELARLDAEREALAREPLRVPVTGSWFVMTQVPIKKALPCHRAIQDAKRAYDRAVGENNRKAAAGREPAPPGPGQAGYAGLAECEYCHKAAVDFWRRTPHAAAWETLTDLGKEHDLECITCHVTGFEEPGGSTLVDSEPLRDVQCEVCHGPGSIHVDEDGKERPPTLVRDTPESRCVTCHNALHSDTFEYRAYLRDVTGPGHGEAFRERLGGGPTGAELRRAALDKAGTTVGAGCDK
jgi:hypothetical protein